MTIEKANAAAAVGGALGVQSAVAEACRAHGTFHGVLRGARDECMAEYVALLKRIERFERVAEVVQARLPRLGAPLLRWAAGKVQALRDMAEPMTEVKWEGSFSNLVTTVGKNAGLDNNLSGSGYTAAWYLGLISSTSYTAVAVGDTMASHSGWLEAGAANAPTYSGSRKTTAWSAASAGSKALSAGLVFTFTGSGTVKGCFMNTVATVDGTTGTLYSAGLFTGGDQPVVSTNTLTVTYTASL